jgi:hypothetical protein
VTYSDIEVGQLRYRAKHGDAEARLIVATIDDARESQRAAQDASSVVGMMIGLTAGLQQHEGTS